MEADGTRYRAAQKAKETQIEQAIRIGRENNNVNVCRDAEVARVPFPLQPKVRGVRPLTGRVANQNALFIGYKVFKLFSVAGAG